MKNSITVIILLFAVACFGQDITLKYDPKSYVNYDTTTVPQIKDTITVSVLCEDYVLVDSSGTFDSGRTFELYHALLGPSIQHLQLERTLQPINIFVMPTFELGISDKGFVVRGDVWYKIISTRWLDPVDGCYQLIPIQKDQR